MAEKSCVSPAGTPPAAPGGMKGPQFSSAWCDVQCWVYTVEIPQFVLLHPHPPSLHDSLWLNGSAHISRLLPCKPRNLFFFLFRKWKWILSIARICNKLFVSSRLSCQWGLSAVFAHNWFIPPHAGRGFDYGTIKPDRVIRWPLEKL